MVLTGRAALEASGASRRRTRSAIGGFERIMGPNGEAQYFATDLADAYRILYEHYRYTYVVPGEARPRLRIATRDPSERDLRVPVRGRRDDGFETRRRDLRRRQQPGPQAALRDARGDGRRWSTRTAATSSAGARWSARRRRSCGTRTSAALPVCLIGIESRNVAREGYRPSDGPASWTGGTLFPLSSKKVARALNAASGNRPVVVLANLSGFDGSPESMRKLQLEYGAEIARAVVEFEGRSRSSSCRATTAAPTSCSRSALNPQPARLGARGLVRLGDRRRRRPRPSSSRARCARGPRPIPPCVACARRSGRTPTPRRAARSRKRRTPPCSRRSASWPRSSTRSIRWSGRGGWARSTRWCRPRACRPHLIGLLRRALALPAETRATLPAAVPVGDA